MKAKIKYLPVYEKFYLSNARYQILYGGGGSGKSVAIAQKCLMRIGRNRKERGVLIRKGKIDLKDSVFREILNVIEDSNLEWKYHCTESPLYIRDKETGNDLIFRGLDDSKKIKSISRPTFIWIEEMAEEGISEEDFDQLDIRIRGEEIIDPCIMGSFNPIDRLSWIRKKFPLLAKSDKQRAVPFEKGDVFCMRTTHLDNPKAGEKYAEIMQVKREAGGVFADVYVDGIWGNADNPDQLIKEKWVNQCITPLKEGVDFLGIDVARFGNDKTTMAHMSGDNLIDIYKYDQKDTSETTLIALTHINDLDAVPENVGVDTVGVGAGVYDQLKTFGKECIEIISGASPFEDKNSVFEFYDLRSQMWWQIREDLRNRRICIKNASDECIEELLTPKYEIRNGKKIKVESKDEIKKRIGRSTDESDALVYANAIRSGVVKNKSEPLRAGMANI